MDVIISNVVKEYEEFKALELTKTPEELYEDAGKIYFYENMYEFFVMFEFNEASLIARELKYICYKGSAKEVNLIDFRNHQCSSISQIFNYLRNDSVR